MLKTCKGCGAELKYKADSLSLKCAYCGALNEITKTVVKTVVSDEKIIPLAITQDELKERVYSYICSNYNTSDEISEDISFSKLDCFYVPVFLFYIKYDATWTASFGYDKTIEINHYKKTTYKNVTDWQPTNGIDKGTFTLFAYAGELLTDSDLAPIDMIPSLVAEGEIRSFDPSFLIGVPVEEASYPESDAFISLEADMNAEIDERIKLHSQGDQQKDWYWTSEETHITNTLYVPFCHAVFDYQGIDYNFWVGGIDQSEVRADSLPIDWQPTHTKTLYPKENNLASSIVHLLYALIVVFFAVLFIGKIVNPTDVEVKSVTPKSTESRKITKSQPQSASEDLAKNLVLQMLEYAMNDGGLINESQIQETKVQIEGFAKPAKGNKKSARKTNDQALFLFNEKHDVDAAVTLFAEANKLDPSDVEILNNLGYLLTKQGDTELAKTILINALILAPSRTNAWLNLGDIFGIEGDKDRALACFSNAFRFSKSKKKTQALMEKWNEIENSESLKESRILAINWAKRYYPYELMLSDTNVSNHQGELIAVNQPNASRSYTLGDKLTDGSIVFYVDASGEHGLVARANDSSNVVVWERATQIVDALRTDLEWRLPSKQEIDLLYNEKSIVGGFANDYYWSSTEEDGVNSAWVQHFGVPDHNYYDKNITCRARAIRSF